MTPTLKARAVVYEDRTPTRFIAVTHGVFGRGTNWLTFARALVRRLPDLGVLLVDLRLHGESPGGSGPHTIAAAALDLASLEVPHGGHLVGVLGHSLGGKIALAFAEPSHPTLRHAWIVDSMPGPSAGEDGEGQRVLRLLRSLPEEFPDRRTFVSAVIDAGETEAVATWLSMNLRAEGDGYRWGLDLDGIEELLRSFHATDLWPTVEGPREGLTVHLIVGGASAAFDEPARKRALAAKGPNTRVTIVEGAGHWVHVDALDTLVNVVASDLRGTDAD
ncbi:MAG: alpha/beta hydrolase [Myxococcales bacterium]|nr:alpha/beta hydrolase [Myxococcales bacterium]